MDIKVNDVVVAGAMPVSYVFQLPSQRLVGPRTQDVDIDAYLGLFKELDERPADGTIGDVPFPVRPCRDDQ